VSFQNVKWSLDVLDHVKMSVIMPKENDLLSKEKTAKCRFKLNILIMCSKTSNQRYTSRKYGRICYHLQIILLPLMSASDGPGIDSRCCHWGIFPWYPRQNHVPWGRLSLWEWAPGFSPRVKEAGAFGWRPTTLEVPKRQENPGP